MFRAGIMLVCVLAVARSARADSLAIEWMDRVTHEVQQQEGPLSSKPFKYRLYGGVYALYTDNLYLTPNRHAHSDAAAIPFVRGRIDYADARFEAAADLLVSFDAYQGHHEARNDQEHFYGKVRYADGVFDLQLVEIVQHVTEPVDSVHVDRARRFITDTMPRAGLLISKVLKFEVSGLVETVHYSGDDFNSRENENYRGGLAGFYRINERFSVGADAGYVRISYRDTDVTPHAEGFYAHVSVRGQVYENLLVEAGAGYSGMRSLQPQPGDRHDARDSDFDAEVHARWQVFKPLLVEADYVRRFGFAGSGSAWQRLDRVTLLVEWKALETVTVRARGQYDRVHPSNAHVRNYIAGGFSVTWQFADNIAVDGGGLARCGNTKGVSGDEWDNWQVDLGIVFSF